MYTPSGLVAMGLVLCSALAVPAGLAAADTPASVLDFTVADIDGRPQALAQYRGTVLLIVNVASKCGFTYQYEGLEQLHQRYRDRGLVILGFPSNDFLGQEPGTAEEIKTFCSLNYGVSFPLFAKIKVKGSKAEPLYQFLTSKKTNGRFGGAISWNFNKFLVNRQGAVVARFGSKEEPTGPAMVAAIEAALAE